MILTCMQVEKLAAEIKLQNSERDSLNGRANEAEMKAKDLSLKLENVSSCHWLFLLDMKHNANKTQKQKYGENWKITHNLYVNVT